MILAICPMSFYGLRSTNPELFRFSNSQDAFEFALKHCIYSAQHAGAKYPAYIKTDAGRLIVRMATYRGV